MLKSHRVRFGFKVGGRLLPNAGIAVFYTDRRTSEGLRDAVSTIRELLATAGQQGIADKIVCDVESK